MTLKDIAKQLTTAVQTVPNLVQILRDGLEQATAGSSVEVTQVVSSGTKIASVKVDDVTTDLYAPTISRDVTSLITVHTGITLHEDFTYKAIQVGNIITLWATGGITAGYSQLNNKTIIFDIDETIKAAIATNSYCLGTNSSSTRATVSNTEVWEYGAEWCSFCITWTL